MEIKSASEVGPLIKRIRKEQGLRQDELAGVSNFSPKFLSDLEGGKDTSPFKSVMRVIQALGGKVTITFPEKTNMDIWGDEDVVL